MCSLPSVTHTSGVPRRVAGSCNTSPSVIRVVSPAKRLNRQGVLLNAARLLLLMGR